MATMSDKDDSMVFSVLSSTPSSVANITKTEEDVSQETEVSIDHQKRNSTAGSSTILAKHETQHVKVLRTIVAIVLVLSTVGITLAIYFYVRHSEQSDLDIGYASDTDRILDGIGMSIHDSLGAMASLGTMMISFARQTNQTFPFVTMPLFAVTASRFLTLTAGIQLSIQPVVTSTQRLQWEEYAMNHEWWVNETKGVQEIDPFYYGEVPYGVPNPPRIINYTSALPYEPK
jgi:hypothetical protein